MPASFKIVSVLVQGFSSTEDVSRQIEKVASAIDGCPSHFSWRPLSTSRHKIT